MVGTALPWHSFCFSLYNNYSLHSFASLSQNAQLKAFYCLKRKRAFIPNLNIHCNLAFIWILKDLQVYAIKTETIAKITISDRKKICSIENDLLAYSYLVE